MNFMKSFIQEYYEKKTAHIFFENFIKYYFGTSHRITRQNFFLSDTESVQ